MNRSPQKAYFWRPGRAGEFWKRVTRRVGPPRIRHFGLRASVNPTSIRPTQVSMASETGRSPKQIARWHRKFELAVNLDPRSNEARAQLQKARSGKQ